MNNVNNRSPGHRHRSAFRRLAQIAATTAIAMNVGGQSAQGAAFTPGNVVVVRVGTVGVSLTSAATAVLLDEYTPSGGGVFVQSVPLPTSDSGPHQILTLSGTANSEGALSLSADGLYLVLGGYDAAPGTASVASTSTTGGATPVLRVIGRVALDGTIDTSTTTTSFSGGNPRGVFYLACSAARWYAWGVVGCRS